MGGEELKRVRLENLCRAEHVDSDDKSELEAGANDGSDNDAAKSEDSVDSVDVLARLPAPASPVFSSSSASSDSVGRSTCKRSAARCESQRRVERRFIPRSLLKMAAAETVRIAKRQLSREATDACATSA